jgi:hypothetical protein
VAISKFTYQCRKFSTFAVENPPFMVSNSRDAEPTKNNSKQNPSGAAGKQTGRNLPGFG